MPTNSKRVPRQGKVASSAIESIDDPRVLAVLQEFRLIFKSVRTHFRSVEKFAGVSGAQVWMLSEIRRSPGLRVNDLARAMSIHQSTASKKRSPGPFSR